MHIVGDELDFYGQAVPELDAYWDSARPSFASASHCQYRAPVYRCDAIRYDGADRWYCRMEHVATAGGCFHPVKSGLFE